MVMTVQGGVAQVAPLSLQAEPSVHVERLSQSQVWTTVANASVPVAETIRIVATGFTGLTTVAFRISTLSGQVLAQDAGVDVSGLAFMQSAFSEPGSYVVEVEGRANNVPFIGMLDAPVRASTLFSVVSGAVPAPTGTPSVPTLPEQITGAVGKGVGDVVGGALSGLTPTLLILGALVVLVAFSPTGKAVGEAYVRR